MVALQLPTGMTMMEKMVGHHSDERLLPTVTSIQLHFLAKREEAAETCRNVFEPPKKLFDPLRCTARPLS